MKDGGTKKRNFVCVTSLCVETVEGMDVFVSLECYYETREPSFNGSNRISVSLTLPPKRVQQPPPPHTKKMYVYIYQNVWNCLVATKFQRHLVRNSRKLFTYGVKMT